MHPALDWDAVDFVGFDLDGTLYDEFDFIAQVYRPIARELARVAGGEAESICDRLLERWLEKGSSYNRLFEEELLASQMHDAEIKTAIERCLSIYRSFKPELHLSTRVEMILDWFSRRFPLFLVTDGGKELQTAKIETLRLMRWINATNISISGCSSQGISKPDARMCSPIEILQKCDFQSISVVYFGDRVLDAYFARNCGFQFVGVKNMIPMGEGMVCS